MFDETLSLPRVRVGHKQLAHGVGYFWLVSGHTFPLSMKPRQETTKDFKLWLLPRILEGKGNSSGMLLTAYFAEGEGEAGAPGEIPFAGFVSFFSSPNLWH